MPDARRRMRNGGVIRCLRKGCSHMAGAASDGVCRWCRRRERSCEQVPCGTPGCQNTTRRITPSGLCRTCASDQHRTRSAFTAITDPVRRKSLMRTAANSPPLTEHWFANPELSDAQIEVAVCRAVINMLESMSFGETHEPHMQMNATVRDRLLAVRRRMLAAAEAEVAKQAEARAYNSTSGNPVPTKPGAGDGHEHAGDSAQGGAVSAADSAA